MHPLQAAVEKNLLTQEIADRIQGWLDEPKLPLWARNSLEELLQQAEWEELKTRFHKELCFGTGGLRGRTIGKVSTSAEKGILSSQGTSEHPGIGTAYLNDFNIIRATLALYRYCISCPAIDEEETLTSPTLVVAHDVRHFSSYFCQLVAQVWAFQGGICYVFDGPRSTPQLSFTARELGTTAGVVITASHNPSYDNGYKAYFSDGAQMIDPHASGVIEYYQSISLGKILDLLPRLKPSAKIQTVTSSIEEHYLEALHENLLDETIFQRHSPKIIYTPIHGTGTHVAKTLFAKYGIDVSYVDEQMPPDPRFPTVASPNPEYAATMQLAIQKANEQQCDIVMGTDPDADRMAIGIRNHQGEMELLSGNTTAALLAEFRLRKMKRMGWLPAEGTSHAVLIKTFVTTPLLEVIASHHGIRCVNTLTGFKWIGAKLLHYENELSEKELLTHWRWTGKSFERWPTGRDARRKAMLQWSHFFVFGGEESCGYLASDRVRDKDAHAAVLMVCEMMADLALEGKSIADFRDELYLHYGYFGESVLNITFDGAEGQKSIQHILHSYRTSPPKEVLGSSVMQFQDFKSGTICDEDGDTIPSENFLFVTLANHYRFAVRGSGTEPKIKYYLFGQKNVPRKEDMAKVQEEVEHQLAQLTSELWEDAMRRCKN
ncbi:MAG: phospho-sugar mutase [Puniceicoccales bacterium]|jgi:phosphoglucomutase|nr:phospho-sugar mutase [Puniceicoccales bacterium]